MATAPASISSSYLLAGPDTGRKSAYIAELAARCAKKDGQEPERHRLYAGDTNPEQLIGLLRNGSLFASRKLVEYRDADALTTKSGIESLATYLASPAEDAVLVLVTESYSLPKPIESRIPANARVVFWELRENEKPAWIRERLSRDGLSADEGAIDAMLELVEPDTAALEAACLSLGACFPPGTRLDAGTMENSLSRSRREDAFSLFDRIAGGELDASLAVLDAILADRQGDAAQIIAGLSWSFRRVEKLHRLVESGASFEEACAGEKLTSKTAQRRFRVAMRKFSPDDCRKALRAASETEALLRGGFPAVFARPLLHLLVDALVSGTGSGLVLSGWKEREYYQSH